jgi:hypothetical protein
MCGLPATAGARVFPAAPYPEASARAVLFVRYSRSFLSSIFNAQIHHVVMYLSALACGICLVFLGESVNTPKPGQMKGT